MGVLQASGGLRWKRWVKGWVDWGGRDKTDGVSLFYGVGWVKWWWARGEMGWHIFGVGLVLG